MKYLLLLLLIVGINRALFSQTPTWQWVRGGGSNSAAVSSWLDEDCQWLGLDQAGNIYGMSMIFDGDIQIDTSHLSHGFGYDDFAVFSYRCDGSFRWVRYFGCGVNDIAWGLHTDTEGNSFIIGGVSPFLNMPLHYGDSITPIATPGLGGLVIVKIDSTGHTVWISFVPPTAPLNLTFFDIQEDSQGNLLILAATDYAGTWGPYTFPGRGFYMLKFNKNDGNIIGLTKLELTGQIWGVQFSVDQGNYYYISWSMGYPATVVVGNDTIGPVSHLSNFGGLAKFDSSGILKWYQFVSGDGDFINDKFMAGRPVLKGKNVYMFGFAEDSLYVFDSLVTIPINATSVLKAPWVISFRQDNGNFIKLKQVYNLAPAEFFSICSTPSGIALGGWGGSPILYNQSDTIHPLSTYNTAYPFVMEIDTGLTYFNWAKATRANNAITHIMSLISDINGNIYAAGMMGDSLYPSTGPGIRCHGGPNDFFVAKISANPDCDCVLAKPMPNLTGFNGYTVSVSGTASGQLDSLYWDWGDGTFTHYMNAGSVITHTYSSGGSYSLCLKAYNYCGIKDSCLNITGVGINEPHAVPLHIYPNPVTNDLYIENPALLKVTATLYTITGNKLFSGEVSDSLISIALDNYPVGVYIMELRLSDGRRCMTKIFRE